MVARGGFYVYDSYMFLSLNLYDSYRFKGTSTIIRVN